MSRNSFLRDSVCAVCWVEKSARSKSLSEVTTRIQDIIKLYIYDGYDKDIMSFPNVICGSCKRNLYLLKSGHTSRGSWGLQVAKVFCILIAIKCILFQFYVKELIFFVWMHYMDSLFFLVI